MKKLLMSLGLSICFVALVQAQTPSDQKKCCDKDKSAQKECCTTQGTDSPSFCKQNHQERMEKIQEMKKTHFKKVLNFSDIDFEQFIKIYDEFSQQKQVIHQNKMKAMEPFFGKKNEDLSEQELKAKMDAKMTYKKAMYEWYTNRHAKLTAQFSLLQVTQIYEAEKSFKHEMMKGYHKGNREQKQHKKRQ